MASYVVVEGPCAVACQVHGDPADHGDPEGHEDPAGHEEDHASCLDLQDLEAVPPVPWVVHLDLLA